LLEEFSPEIRREFGVTIGDECFGDPVEAEGVVTEEASELNGAVVNFGGDDVDVLGEAINENTDGVVTFGCFGEASHEIDRDRVPTSRGDGQWLEEAGGGK
jgi:hypothetical protein